MFLNMYRPSKYYTVFSDDSVQLSLICPDLECVLIVGDFNTHVDKPEDLEIT